MSNERDLLWMARRYAHGRHTYAPGIVRDAVKRLGCDTDATLACVRDNGNLLASASDCLCDDCLRTLTGEGER
jgi:hypothetical protein